jgi:hypothetical protein
MPEAVLVQGEERHPFADRPKGGVEPIVGEVRAQIAQHEPIGRLLLQDAGQIAPRLGRDQESGTQPTGVDDPPPSERRGSEDLLRFNPHAGTLKGPGDGPARST